MSQKTYILAISGASGSYFAKTCLKSMVQTGAKVFLVASPTAKQIWLEEMNEGSLEDFIKTFSPDEQALIQHENIKNLSAAISSGSFRHDGMIIMPCSAKCLAAIANGFSSNLIERAADVCLKERFPLVIGLRETPLSAIHLENALKLSRIGAQIVPCIPGFYHGDNSFEGMVNFVAGKALDQINIDHKLFKRWKEDDHA
ncbi:UbiX family flavin prenyltransferase [Lentisphaera profundi]|uniref:Flavin prenyltransferase UbiX n=1 Tax=Lentisphaera profundi TaxID=1658616 RepID=A0ABY7VX81_9BACT|nr:UbiX family flavin prenyltransferase [Lentisphaera profundi]WDE98805.1 UbiX family flavin prenyltransferase [Lentisphaera profundi]